MKTWTRDVVLCSDGAARLSGEERRKLLANGIDVYEKKIRRLEGTLGKLERIVFEDGDTIPRTALFFSTGNVQRSELPFSIGCTLTPKGAVTGREGSTEQLPWRVRRRRCHRRYAVCDGCLRRRREGGDAHQR